MSKINLLRIGTGLFGTEKLEVSMFIRSDIQCHLAHDVKKNITDLGKLSISSDLSSIFSDERYSCV